MAAAIELQTRPGSSSSSASSSNTATSHEGILFQQPNGDDGKLTDPEELEIRDLVSDSEDDALIEKEEDEEEVDEPPVVPAPLPKSSFRSALLWMSINTFATIGIVFTNKAIFSDPSLKLAQLSFAAFHFFITYLTLFVLSRPSLAFFVPRRAGFRDMLPLSIAMSLNVILPNLSLAFSSVTFYQVARILLTPTVAAMNFVLYRAKLPRGAIISLIPACVGVGMVSYYDSLPTKDQNIKTTSSLGVIFAFLGILASSLYTVWIASYHRKLQMSSMQLLFNQAPLSAFMLLYVIPFVDTFPTWTKVPLNRWLMILMSGGFASLINISQFFIIAQTGPVSSTVVGHVKTCTIVTLGWITSGRGAKDMSVLGVVVAIGGIIAYSIVMLQEKKKQAARG
ncbi:hypothetical protein QBC35DRAFT_378129 [Podospora australis]|uniref:GDP-mannose transporter n=1 Tax=Podospora australis TaxID=1536484 RepID=A0AAN6X1J3_9PEZI|nr:hypothetical protein QBC35DRAFT_378129 [Podospora australis]